MPLDQPTDLTTVLAAVNRGDAGASSQLLPLVYEELRKLAAQKMSHEPGDHTLQATALVHEAYMRLVGDRDPSWQNRAHFFGAAAEAMRRILVERARRRNQLKRGGGRGRIDLDAASASVEIDPAEVLAIDAALEGLRDLDPRICQIIKLRCFVGLTIAQTAEALNVSARTIDRDWTVARAWLKSHLDEAGPGDGERASMAISEDRPNSGVS